MKRKTEFNAKTRNRIKERDGGCIFCMQQYHTKNATWLDLNTFSIMHYIPRSKGGLGIEENGAVGCNYHHFMMDNGKEGRREEMLGIFKEYLMRRYPGWDESKLTYSKWGFLKVNE